MKLDFSPMARVTIWQALIAEEDPLQSRKLASDSNTNPNDEKIYIPKEKYGDWTTCESDPFPDFAGIQQYAKDAGVWEILQKDINNEDYLSVISTTAIPLVSEIAVEISLKPHFDIVNLALKKTGSPGVSVLIANRKAAIKNVKEELTTNMEPDRASFIYKWRCEKMDIDGENPDQGTADDDLDESQCYYSCFCICNYDKNKLNDNLIPDEVKVAYKFQMKHLNATVNHIRLTSIAIPDGPRVQGSGEGIYTNLPVRERAVCALRIPDHRSRAHLHPSPERNDK